MRRLHVCSLVVAALLVLAGCSALGVADSTADPASDRLGWENGYWHDEAIAVTSQDGYNASEREAIVSRTMARVEKLRDLEFNKSVPVEVISRDQYLANRSSGSGGNGPSTHTLWNNQVWEGLFIVGEETSTAESFNSTLGASVQGYYAPGKGKIVIVSDSATPTLDTGTLAHELVHALQDQHLDMGASADTQDRQLAVDGLVEGDANLVQQLYRQRCGGKWRCLPKPAQSGGGSAPSGYNRGLFLTIYQPYATGPEFVDSLREDGGWAAVNDAYSKFPASTEQTIHPALYPDETPVNVSVRDRSNTRWDRFNVDPVADTVGEASIYAMFVDNDVVTVEGQAVFSYQSKPSAGWAGDSLVPYQNGAGDYGYVWKTVWDTETDAKEFLQAYHTLLEKHDARNPRQGVYVVPDSDPFGDAFRVVRNGKTVRIVNAPRVSQLDRIHASR
ncbi:MAG: Hvo_1808 family surface protein [Haloarculaceae archaeon]